MTEEERRRTLDERLDRIERQVDSIRELVGFIAAVVVIAILLVGALFVLDRLGG